MRMNRVARRSVTVLVLVALLLGGFGFFLVEFFIQSPTWATSAHSPHVIRRLNSGAVTDRDGILLLDMENGGTYSSGEAIRKATLHWVGDRAGNIQVPAVPNYYGQLVGYDGWNGMYTFGGPENTESVVTLTVAARLQAVALEAMGNQKGTVAVYNYKTGEILCAVTTPTYDPDNVPDIEGNPEQYEGAYMNRFVQSAYPPGSIFKTVTLAAALDTLPDAEALTFTCTGSWGGGEYPVTCESVHGSQNLQQAFSNSCNCAFAELSGLVGADALSECVESYGIMKPVTFDGIETASGNFEKSYNSISLAWSAIGQYTDLVNPCGFLLYMGVIAGDGKAAVPYVVASAETAENGYTGQTVYTGQVVDGETAETVHRYMRYTVENKYGDSNFPGLRVCAKTGTAELDDGKASNAMLAGFVENEEYPLAFIICVEGGGYGRQTCVPIASKVLTACKEYLDQ